MHIAVYTWNAGQTLDASNALNVSTWLKASEQAGVQKFATPPAIYAIGLQESIELPWALAGWTTQQIQKYEEPIRQEIARHVQASYPAGKEQRYLLTSKQVLGGLAVLVYATEEIAARIDAVSTASVGCGALFMSNKGAAGVSLSLANPKQRITFVTAHLAAHDYNLNRRNADWRDIVRRMSFHDPGSKAEYQIHDSDYAFIFGDLNYRLSLARPRTLTLQELGEKLSKGNHASLLEHDQLTQEHKSEKTLHGFQEASIPFPPSYKYRPGTNDLTDFRKRVPSWCDRILYHAFAGKVDAQRYGLVYEPNASDHKVVFGRYELVAESASRPKISRSSPFSKDPQLIYKAWIGWIMDKIVGFAWCATKIAGAGNEMRGIAVLLLASSIFLASEYVGIGWQRSIVRTRH